LPAVGSRVVYFPQGHSEQVSKKDYDVWLLYLLCYHIISLVDSVCVLHSFTNGENKVILGISCFWFWVSYAVQ
jgi:hypothetical protein